MTARRYVVLVVAALGLVFGGGRMDAVAGAPSRVAPLIGTAGTTGWKQFQSTFAYDKLTRVASQTIISATTIPRLFRRCSSVVEQRFREPQVRGTYPRIGSKDQGWCSSGRMFGNPPLSCLGGEP